MRALCTGDLHLGVGGSYCPTPGQRLAEQEALWTQIVQTAAEREVDAILFAGDAFEGIPMPEHYAAFLRPLRSAPCPVIAISGNGRHDAAARDMNAVEVLDIIASDRIRVRTRSAVTEVAGVAIACLPWAPVKRIVAAHGGGDRDDIHALAAELLLEVARGLRAEIPADQPAILLTHFSITGASLPGGMSSDDLREPVLSLGDLEAIGFDAIVAGHLHPPQLLATNADEPEMPIFYVGSPMPLSFGEDYDHGVWILTSAEIGMSGVLSWQPEFVPLESRRFLTIDVDLARDFADDLVQQALLSTATSPDLEPGAFVKIRYRATTEQARRVDHTALRQTLLDAGAFNVWIVPEIEHELRARVQGLDETVSDVHVLEQWMESQSVNGTQAPALRSLHGDYLAEVGL